MTGSFWMSAYECNDQPATENSVHKSKKKTKKWIRANNQTIKKYSILPRARRELRRQFKFFVKENNMKKPDKPYKDVLDFLKAGEILYSKTMFTRSPCLLDYYHHICSLSYVYSALALVRSSSRPAFLNTVDWKIFANATCRISTVHPTLSCKCLKL